MKDIRPWLLKIKAVCIGGGDWDRNYIVGQMVYTIDNQFGNLLNIEPLRKCLWARYLLEGYTRIANRRWFVVLLRGDKRVFATDQIDECEPAEITVLSEGFVKHEDALECSNSRTWSEEVGSNL